MQIKIGPDDARLLQDNYRQQMNGRLAELLDKAAAGPPGHGYPEPPGDGQSAPDGARGPRPEPRAGAEASAKARAEAGTRARARAIGASWRIDALGRLLDAAGARRNYGGRRHPPGPVGRARAR